jgi:hypothetical protein
MFSRSVDSWKGSDLGPWIVLLHVAHQRQQRLKISAIGGFDGNRHKDGNAALFCLQG